MIILLSKSKLDGHSNQLKINRDLKEWLQKVFCFSIYYLDYNQNDNLVIFVFKKIFHREIEKIRYKAYS